MLYGLNVPFNAFLLIYAHIKMSRNSRALVTLLPYYFARKQQLVAALHAVKRAGASY